MTKKIEVDHGSHISELEVELILPEQETGGKRANLVRIDSIGSDGKEVTLYLSNDKPFVPLPRDIVLNVSDFYNLLDAYSLKQDKMEQIVGRNAYAVYSPGRILEVVGIVPISNST